ncbi:MAG: 1-deoxy-D-xylulose-5-phosphate reductoisomerase [Clostridia bacterium]|nr:1-deoxy-D-xylulose-5-phosphate reductoisomerase [Clostridia bacterium]
MSEKIIGVLGATGSVGTQALDVARERGYKVDLLFGNKNITKMESLAREFSPARVVMASEAAASSLRLALKDTATKVLGGRDALGEAIALSSAETVVNAVSGSDGLLPTLEVIESGKRLALANKESLVVAGDIVMESARQRGAQILPVDSEHCAIFQSMMSGSHGEIKSIILTASGGPFRDKSIEELESVTLEDTLAHPTWSMGQRITVDSATLMNKGFEIIEAVHLFGIPEDAIKVVVHRESILHSAVEYIDNSIIAEMSVPDMRMCVQYAVDFPERKSGVAAPLDLAAIGRLSFEEPRLDAFPLLSLARCAIFEGGAMPAVLNAADEVAVAAFLRGELRFADIARVVESTYLKLGEAAEITDLGGILSMDLEARAAAKEAVKAIIA